MYLYMYKEFFLCVSFHLHIQNFLFIFLPKNLKIKVKTKCKFTSFLHYVIELNAVAFRKEYRLIVFGNLGAKLREDSKTFVMRGAGIFTCHRTLLACQVMRREWSMDVARM
jgi:hypothetical protein